ncbi:MAG: class I SAM-dependent methyltransferase [Saprospiraceae bacterium]
MDNAHVRYLSSPALFQEKENRYLEVRRREGRVLPDEVVKNLPNLPASNPYAREWKWRERSLKRLQNQLPESLIPKKSGSGSSALKVLDLGCGNGWMANRLAENPDWDVWAVDLNQEELEQGARLFGRENLQFAYADVLQGVLPENYFDIIALAASVQYFPDLGELLAALRNLLNAKGEIHLLDSPFYKNEPERAAARRRTLEYYTKLGVPEMADFYHHHLWPEAENLGAENLNGGLKARFLQKAKWLAPFPWLRFRNQC